MTRLARALKHIAKVAAMRNQFITVQGDPLPNELLLQIRVRIEKSNSCSRSI